jgi:hypothetical protein
MNDLRTKCLSVVFRNLLSQIRGRAGEFMRLCHPKIWPDKCDALSGPRVDPASFGRRWSTRARTLARIAEYYTTPAQYNQAYNNRHMNLVGSCEGLTYFAHVIHHVSSSQKCSEISEGSIPILDS